MPAMAIAGRRKSWLRWVLLAGAVLIVWQLAASLVIRRSGPGHLANQIWLERLPANPRDMVWHFVAIDHDGRRVGSLGRASRWRLFSDGFVWAAEGHQLRGRFPQDDCHLNLQVRTWKCGGKAPKPFDLCLELTGEDKQVYRYFSRTEWVVRPRGTTVAELDWLAPALAATLAQPAGEPMPAGRDDSARCWQRPGAP